MFTSKTGQTKAEGKKNGLSYLNLYIAKHAVCIQ